MGRSPNAKSEIDLRTVATALEGAGFTIAGMLETNLTVEKLFTTKRPVVVLVNDQASQCMLVDVLPEQSNHVSSFSLPHMSGSWRADSLRQIASAADEITGAPPRDAVLATELAVPATAPLGLYSKNERLSSATSNQGRAAHGIGHVLATLKHTRVPLRVAVAQFAALAMLGGLSGNFLRSPWLLALMPVMYTSAVVARSVRGTWGDEGEGATHGRPADRRPQPPEAVCLASVARTNSTDSELFDAGWRQGWGQVWIHDHGGCSAQNRVAGIN
jgi:hypothetical protein